MSFHLIYSLAMGNISRLRGFGILALGFVAAWPTLAGDEMTTANQNAIIAKYCAVCHNDAHENGGLTLEHFDAAHADPSLVAMLISKIRDGGAISAAGLPRPDGATQDALLRALMTESVGASNWTLSRTQDSITAAPIMTASIVEEVPLPANAPQRYAGDNAAPDLFRLSITCHVDTHEAEIRVAWAPGVPPKGSLMSVAVDGKPMFTSPIDGSEKMFKGTVGTMGTGATILNRRLESSGSTAMAIPLPEQSLTINNLFQNGTVVFPFDKLPLTTRQALSSCFRSE